ncbi:MAG: hypothetical protein U0270_00055 [Labilithrix sp.]
MVAFVAAMVGLAAACGNSIQDACEHANELCANQPGFTIKSDCSQAEAEYDKLPDAQKEKQDKAADCINDAESCTAVFQCLVNSGAVPSGSSGTDTSSSSSSSSGEPVPGGPCDPAKCFTGNECLPLDGVEECRKTCASNDDPNTSCPFNYNCVSTDPANNVKPFCVATTARTNDGEKLQQKEGQWGAPCQANQGSKNPACDYDQRFYCYGISPTDGDAYCTRYDCESDLECGPGFACVDINTTPNVATSKKKAIGKTQKVCLRRTYCSPCTADVDCTTIEGTKQHCIRDSVGRGFCTPECETNSNCNNEAKCVTAKLDDNSSAKVCYPRSKVCIGEKDKLCSSCLVDTDCGEGGVCTHGQFTTEKFCILPAPGGDCTKCPAEAPTTPPRKVGCSKQEDDLYPAAYCIPLYSIGGTVGADIGCWTPDR